jgi:Domain of unknown function (DUF427)
MPRQLTFGDDRIPLFTTLTAVGTPRDITLDELAAELSYPADDETDRFSMIGTPRVTAPSRDGLIPHRLRDRFRPSETVTHCTWNGDANYYDVVVDGRQIDDADSYDAHPYHRALAIKDYIAFWKGVRFTGESIDRSISPSQPLAVSRLSWR